MMTTQICRLFALGGAAALALGCTSATAPQAEYTEAKTAIGAAEAEGAQDIPQASLYLKVARDNAEKAKELMDNDEHEAAEMLLERAQADAELARSLTQEAKVRKEAEDEIQRVQSLKDANQAELKKDRSS